VCDSPEAYARGLRAEIPAADFENRQRKGEKLSPLELADRKPGEWNTFLVRMVGDEVTICTSVEIIIEGTVKEGSEVTWDAGLFSGEHTWDMDESVDFTIPLSYETTAPAGSSVSNNSTTTLNYDGPIEWTGPGGQPSIDADVDITITINVIVETKEGGR